MYDLTDKKGKVVARLWLPIEAVEHSALQQIENMSRHPRLHKWVAIMPDVHLGIGATIGAVMPLREALIPAAVGVDIGCGMCSVQTDLTVKEIKNELPKIHKKIIDQIPMGFEHRSSSQIQVVHRYASGDILKQIESYGSFCDRAILPQLGTLGGGNHFIELQKDRDDKIWVMLHSGSRNIGNILATHHIKTARRISGKEKRELPQGLDYLDEFSTEGETYIRDMTFAMEFARQNRFVMVGIIKEILSECFEGVRFSETINIHHNYAAREKHFGKDVWVHRKGATRVRRDITGIIPGSMAAPSYIVTGRDNEESFDSCSHGAGRRMSRRRAKETISLAQFREKMNGIYSESVNKSHLDEAPSAYKKIDEVMERQKDLVEIQTRLEPIMNIKG